MGKGKTGRPRVLMVTRNFPPMVGGMERLLYHAYDELSQACEMALVAPAGARDHAVGASAFAGCGLNPLPRFLLDVSVQAVRVARRFRPDLVFSGSGLVALPALIAARSSGARTACYLHGLDVIARSRIYQHLFVPAIRQFDLAIANSRNTAQLAATRGVAEARLRVLHPGVALPPAVDRAAFRREIGLDPDMPMLLSVGRLTGRKGLVEFIDLALPAVVARYPNLRLVVIGDEASHAAVRGVSANADKVRETAAARHVSANVIMLRGVDDRTLGSAYAAADLLVFPVLDRPDDVEGFGMVAVEAAAHGLPTVAFRVGGVPDAVSDGISGHLVASGDYQGFADVIKRHLSERGRHQQWADACRRFASDFAWPLFGQRLRELCFALL